MNVADALRSALRPHLSAISIESLVQRHITTPTIPVDGISATERSLLLDRLAASVSLFSRNNPEAIRSDMRQALGLSGVEAEASPSSESTQLSSPVVTVVQIRTEVDVSVARNEARRLTTDAGASQAMAVKVATAVSELARNIILYAGSGSIELDAAPTEAGPRVRIVASDNGPGIEKERLDAMFSGTYRSKTGLGKGLSAVKRIANAFDVETAVGSGTTVRVTFRGRS